MSAQTIVTPSGERLVVLPEAEYRSLLAAAEDAADIETVREFRRRFAAGEEELIPAVIVGRILGGENAVRVWREHRRMSSAALAEQAEIGQGYLSQLENGKRDGTIETMKKIAAALGIALDDLVG